VTDAVITPTPGESKMNLKDKNAIVTGASRGIGREIAKVIAANGGKVALIARSKDALLETKSMVDSYGGESLVLPVDLRDEKAVGQVVETVTRTWEHVDIIVNNAAAWHNDARMYYGPRLWETPTTEIDEVLDVGIKAPIYLTRALLPGMIERKSGKILQVSGGFAGIKDAIGWLHCYVQKKAIEHFTEGLAEELRIHEIQVNCISPWYVATEPVHQFLAEQIQNAIEPEEVAKLALFLMSTESDHITGQVILIRNKLDHGDS
jgi:3-oxoacyl-[acyl-carrier protein] reductase